MGELSRDNRRIDSVERTTDQDEKEASVVSSVRSASAAVMKKASDMTVKQAGRTFRKPEEYTGNRSLYDSGSAKRELKEKAFKNNSEVRDSYMGEELELRKADAKLKYGDDWPKHLAESDHITPLEKVFQDNKNNPWLTNEDIKEIGNQDSNMEITSRKYNNAKRSRTNEEFVTDNEYLRKTGVELSEEGKQKAIAAGKRSQTANNRESVKRTVKNAAKTGHEAGVQAVGSASATTVTLSGINNIVAVINGEKSAEEALADTVADTGKAAVESYALAGGLTIVTHSLTASSSKFIKALADNGVPGKIITAVYIVGNTLKSYARGEISTRECILELGEKGTNFAATSASMWVGQALIPIPIVGAAVGALVGSVVTNAFGDEIAKALAMKEHEHQERQRIIRECEAAAAQTRAFRKELEGYLEQYFADYQGCFDEVLSGMKFAFEVGDAYGVIAGANDITRKLGGDIRFETMEEFDKYLEDDSEDIL